MPLFSLVTAAASKTKAETFKLLKQETSHCKHRGSFKSIMLLLRFVRGASSGLPFVFLPLPWFASFCFYGNEENEFKEAGTIAMKILILFVLWKSLLVRFVMFFFGDNNV